MIRPLAESDFDTVISIVNRNWKDVYTGYVNQELLNEAGCQERGQQLKKDFISHRLSEYVWVESGQILGLLSMGQLLIRTKPTFLKYGVYISQ